MFNILAVVYFVVLIIIAHRLTPKEYNWQNNTISELSSQQYRYKWIMQIGFSGYGLLLSFGLIFDLFVSNYDIFRYFPFIIYAISIALSGIFCTKPFINDASYSNKESNLHSLFAQLAGISFSLGILLFFFFEDTIGIKIVHFIFFLFVIITSFLFGVANKYKGILQRILYLGSFVWIVIYL